ncbi:hypothetical protein DFQ28_011757, partial [Apophysomyces sp. BC1034]
MPTTLQPRVRSLQINQSMPQNSACVVTSYGQAIFASNQTLNLQTLEWNSSETLNELQSEIAMAMWNDWLIVAGETTTVFDVRTPSSWIRLPMHAPTPAPSFGARMAVTSRWILHFSTIPQSALPTNAFQLWSYTTTVHCFDPINLVWIGKLIDFATMTDQINVASTSSDTLLVAPARLESVPSHIKMAISLPQQGLWELSVSTQEPRCNISWIAPASYCPVAGASMTTITENQVVVFYGGDRVSIDNIQFWNITTMQFLNPPPWWVEAYRSTLPTTQQKPSTPQPRNTTVPRYVAIILGCLLGTLVVL